MSVETERWDLLATHEAGNAQCAQCDHGWPKPCKCGGLIHGETEPFGEHYADMGLLELYECCDLCDYDYEVAA